MCVSVKVGYSEQPVMSSILYANMKVAEYINRGTENPRVGGSIPSLGTSKIKRLRSKTVSAFYVMWDFVCDFSETHSQARPRYAQI